MEITQPKHMSFVAYSRYFFDESVVNRMNSYELSGFVCVIGALVRIPNSPGGSDLWLRKERGVPLGVVLHRPRGVCHASGGSRGVSKARASRRIRRPTWTANEVLAPLVWIRKDQCAWKLCM